MTAH